MLGLVCGVAFPQRPGKGAETQASGRERTSGFNTWLRRNIDTKQGAVGVQIRVLIPLTVTFANLDLEGLQLQIQLL